jgi:hypothetical protein
MMLGLQRLNLPLLLNLVLTRKVKQQLSQKLQQQQLLQQMAQRRRRQRHCQVEQMRPFTMLLARVALAPLAQAVALSPLALWTLTLLTLSSGLGAVQSAERPCCFRTPLVVVAAMILPRPAAWI